MALDEEGRLKRNAYMRTYGSTPKGKALRKAGHVAASKRRRVAKLRALELLGARCFICGEDHPATLQFHHRDPLTKAFQITDAIGRPKTYPWAMIELELEKCDILCANCHAIHHWVEY